MNTALKVTEEWKRGWSIVLTAAAGLSFLSVVMSGFGTFIGPLGTEFGWSRATLTMGMAIAGVVVLLLSPFAGMLVDRYGPRRLALPGVIIMSLATAAFSLANGSILLWACLWTFYALAHVSMMMSIWTGAVARAFDAGRGLALGMTLVGSGVAQTVIPSLSTWLIDGFGWRQAYLILGFGWGGVTLLLCWLFLDDARGPSARKAKAARDAVVLDGLSIAQAWRNPALWRIAISTLLLMLLTMALAVHQIPIMIDAGLSREFAALLAGLSGIAGMAGNVVTGALMDRYRANWVGGITLGITALAFALLLDGVRTPLLIFIAMMISGYSAGTKLQICGYLTSRFGGLRNYGAIFGFMGSLIAIGGALGPFLAGLIYDWTGGYDTFVIVGMIGCFIAGVLILTLPRYPQWQAGSSVHPEQNRAMKRGQTVLSEESA
ncbi:Predicted arabinose efflux permease, MFS family [Novosphingobium sp. CF614]|uniref:MFS transporter n=1 Tax=Novosphingobium sp. CF614 TaxID=1884364 RepID=UPI0008DF78A7|nr:MFS transporter [Novosphingobium sp. CF614]SFF92228.1 Predicted arabinose efflux permease, MFS family [Novosphingobium sp. CF614]